MLHHFKHAHQLGHIIVLREKVDVWTDDPSAPLNAPCLYEFALYEGTKMLIGVYVGQASRGIGRPIEQYEEQLVKLRKNREAGIKRNQDTPHHFRGTNVWGFRWIHHELERTLFLRTSGRVARAELCIHPLPISTAAEALTQAERERIKLWQRDMSQLCINKKPAIKSASESALDPVWRQ